MPTQRPPGFTPEDQVNPSYCRRCRAHIPGVTWRARGGLCDRCFRADAINPAFTFDGPKRDYGTRITMGVLCGGVLLLLLMISCNGPRRSPNSPVGPPRPTTVGSMPSPAAPPAATPRAVSARALRTDIIPFTTAQGEAAQMALVTWQNTGTVPLKAVYARITAYDEYGNVLESSIDRQCIFAYEDNYMRAIPPGGTYTDPPGTGYILFPAFGHAAAVSASVVRVDDKGAEERYP